MIRFLAGDRAKPVAFALAMALGVATSVIGFYADDWPLIATLEGKAPRSASPLDLYRFGTGDAELTREFMRLGPWPWWTYHSKAPP